MDSLTKEQKLYLNKRIAYTALMIRVCIPRDTDSPLIRENDRYLTKRKFNCVVSQINKINRSSRATKIQEGEDIVLDNISSGFYYGEPFYWCHLQVDYIEQSSPICVQAVKNEGTNT